LFKKLSLIFLAVLALFLLFGCTAPAQICGDGICSEGEDGVCPTDCVAPVSAKVNVSVNGAWDAQGDVSLRWHHSKTVTASLNQDIVSRLGDHWVGQQNKNLYISFNDSKSGEIPITPEKRQYTISVTEPGDYYFEAISEDYAYRAVSEKVTIVADGEKYVSLNLFPSNPAVRIRAYDESGNVAFGKASIELYVQESNCKYGECTTNEWLYNTQSFDEGTAINGLFFMYVPKGVLEQKSIQYKAVIKKEGYLDYIMQVVPYSKYQEYDVLLSKVISSEKGSLKVSISPGIGTTQEDLAELEGLGIIACATGECLSSKVLNGSVYFAELPYGTYYVYGDYTYDSMSSHPPVSMTEVKVTIDSSSTSAVAKGLRGVGMKLFIVDGNGRLIDTVNEPIYSIQSCMTNGDSNYCSQVNDPPQRIILEKNPAEFSQRISSEQQIIDLQDDFVYIELMYMGKRKWFSYGMKQGYNEYIWKFDPVKIDHNYVEDVPVGGSIYVDGAGNYIGEVLEIRLLNVVQVGQNNPFQGQFGLYRNGTLLKVVQRAPPFNLRDEFGTNFVLTTAQVEAVFLKLADEKYYATVRVN